MRVVVLGAGLMGKWIIGSEVSRQLMALKCAAAGMLEGMFHIAPAFIVTEAVMDFIAEQVQTMLDRLAKAIPVRLAQEPKR